MICSRVSIQLSKGSTRTKRALPDAKSSIHLSTTKLSHGPLRRLHDPPLLTQQTPNPPPEIRLQIWSHAFQLAPTRSSIQLSYQPSQRHSLLRALLACRLLHSEAYHLFYAQHELHLSTPAQLFHFLAALSPLRRAAVRALRVSNLGAGHYAGSQLAAKAFGLLALCPALEALAVEIDPGEFCFLSSFLFLDANV